MNERMSTIGLSSSALKSESTACLPSSCSEKELEIVLEQALEDENENKKVEIYDSKAKNERPDVDIADIIFT